MNERRAAIKKIKKFLKHHKQKGIIDVEIKDYIKRSCLESPNTIIYPLDQILKNLTNKLVEITGFQYKECEIYASILIEKYLNNLPEDIQPCLEYEKIPETVIEGLCNWL